MKIRVVYHWVIPVLSWLREFEKTKRQPCLYNNLRRSYAPTAPITMDARNRVTISTRYKPEDLNNPSWFAESWPPLALMASFLSQLWDMTNFFVKLGRANDAFWLVFLHAGASQRSQWRKMHSFMMHKPFHAPFPSLFVVLFSHCYFSLVHCSDYNR